MHFERGNTLAYLKFEFVRFNGNDFHHWQFLDENLRLLPCQAAILQVPRGTFEVEASDEASLMCTFIDVLGRFPFGHLRVQRGFIERPAVLSARRLYERSQVRFRYVKARQPDNVRLSLVDLNIRSGLDLVLTRASMALTHPVYS